MQSSEPGIAIPAGGGSATPPAPAATEPLPTTSAPQDPPASSSPVDETQKPVEQTISAGQAPAAAVPQTPPSEPGIVIPAGGESVTPPAPAATHK